MRVLILSQYFWPESFRINSLAEALESAGAHVTVLTGQPNYPDGVVFPGYQARGISRERRGKRIDVLRVPLFPRGKRSGSRLAMNYLSFIVSASVFGPWLLRDRDIDVIFVYAPSPIVQAIPGIFLKHLKKARLVTWVQDLWPQSLEMTGFVKNERILNTVERVVRWIYRHNDRLLGQSRAFVDAIEPLSGGTPVDYFPNPGEALFADPDVTSPPAIQLPTGFNVVFTGNLGTVQALDTVIEAAWLLRDDRDVRFVLVGSGSRSEWLATEVARRGLSNVLIAGRFDTSAMPAILAQASATLVSLSRGKILSQTIPAKVQAYLAAGRPILASLDGEAATLIESAGAGYSSAAEDAPGLADNVRRLKRLTSVERSAMGAAAARCYDQQFRPDVLALRLLESFAMTMASSPSSRTQND